MTAHYPAALIESQNYTGFSALYGDSKTAGFRLSLDQFQIKDDQTGKRAILGEELLTDRSPVVEGRLSATDGGHYSVAVSMKIRLCRVTFKNLVEDRLSKYFGVPGCTSCAGMIFAIF